MGICPANGGGLHPETAEIGIDFGAVKGTAGGGDHSLFYFLGVRRSGCSGLMKGWIAKG